MPSLHREDIKSSVYVENLTKEFVSIIKDITHILVRGLANRRVGATSINVESYYSDSVFTCVVESQCKMSTLKNLGLNVVKANVFLDSSGKHTTFAITRDDTGWKVDCPELLEAIRLTIINNMLEFHSVSRIFGNASAICEGF